MLPPCAKRQRSVEVGFFACVSCHNFWTQWIHKNRHFKNQATEPVDIAFWPPCCAWCENKCRQTHTHTHRPSTVTLTAHARRGLNILLCFICGGRIEWTQVLINLFTSHSIGIYWNEISIDISHIKISCRFYLMPLLPHVTISLTHRYMTLCMHACLTVGANLSESYHIWPLCSYYQAFWIPCDTKMVMLQPMLVPLDTKPY